MGRGWGFYRVLDDWYVYRLNVYVNIDIVMCPLLLGGLDLSLSLLCFVRSLTKVSLILSLTKVSLILSLSLFLNNNIR